MKNNIKTTITIGIPTYEAGENLVTALASIYKQSLFKQAVTEVLLIVDGRTISEDILSKIKHSSLKIVYGKTRKGQSGRINDLFNIAKSDLIILTNDDVILDKDALKNILDIHYNTSADLITTHVKPLKPTNLLQKIIYIGYELTDSFSLNWNDRNNYYSCNGRMICLSKRFYKEIKIPEKLWNNDAFIYLFAKINNYKIAHANGAFCYYLLPSTLKEHIKQSTKFKASFRENQKYFTTSIKKFYITPPKVIFRDTFKYFTKNPFRLIAYILIVLIAKIAPTDKKLNKNGYWETDKSTKNIGGKLT